MLRYKPIFRIRNRLNIIKTLFFLIIIQSVFLIPVSQGKDWWDQKLKNPFLIGEGVLKVFIWDVYELRLFSKTNMYDRNDIFVLEFEYLRDTSKASVIKASIVELKKLNLSKTKLEKWEKYLEKSIKDMKAGEKAALLFRPNLGITFYASDRFNITIDNVEFANSYIDIWLGDNTARPKLRKQQIQFLLSFIFSVRSATNF